MRPHPRPHLLHLAEEHRCPGGPDAVELLQQPGRGGHVVRGFVGEATQVSTGDVDLRYAHFDTRSGDDITHEVASAFDRMLNALRFYALADEAGAGGDE